MNIRSSRLMQSAPLFATAAACVLAATALGGSFPLQCDGYCSTLPPVSCGYTELPCCCKIAGTWTCVCLKPTDCNSGNNCQ